MFIIYFHTTLCALLVVATISNFSVHSYGTLKTD